MVSHGTDGRRRERKGREGERGRGRDSCGDDHARKR